VSPLAVAHRGRFFVEVQLFSILFMGFGIDLVIIEEHQHSKKERRSEMNMDARSNRTLTAKVRMHLCNALCNEIQIYKRLLLAAENLDKVSRKESMDELLLSCPNELSEVTSC